MALTYTPPAEIGFVMPSFCLPATNGKTVSSSDLQKSKAAVIMFICNHCPYVQAIEDRLIALANNYKDKNVSFVAICSNDPKEHEQDSFQNLKKRAEEKNYSFPYLFDENQSVAKAFTAVCTPDLFVYQNQQQNLKLFYRGQLDDSWKDPAKVETQALKHALDLALNDKAAPVEQTPSMGCSIKWRE